MTSGPGLFGRLFERLAAWVVGPNPGKEAPTWASTTAPSGADLRTRAVRMLLEMDDDDLFAVVREAVLGRIDPADLITSTGAPAVSPAEALPPPSGLEETGPEGGDR